MQRAEEGGKTRKRDLSAGEFEGTGQDSDDGKREGEAEIAAAWFGGDDASGVVEVETFANSLKARRVPGDGQLGILAKAQLKRVPRWPIRMMTFFKKPFKSIPSHAVSFAARPTTPVQTLMLCLINVLHLKRESKNALSLPQPLKQH